jgi:hypothetical protein
MCRLDHKCSLSHLDVVPNQQLMKTGFPLRCGLRVCVEIQHGHRYFRNDRNRLKGLV